LHLFVTQMLGPVHGVKKCIDWRREAGALLWLQVALMPQVDDDRIMIILLETCDDRIRSIYLYIYPSEAWHNNIELAGPDGWFRPSGF